MRHPLWTPVAGAVITLLTATTPATAERAWEPVEQGGQAFGLPQMRVVRAEAPPIIDGSADDAAWSAAQAGSLVHAVSGGRAPVQTTFRMAWDDAHLYLFVRGVERGQESFVTGPAGAQDPGVHEGDAVELFLQPGGPDSPYLQVAANPWGGHIDYRWAQPGQPLDWEAAGMTLAGHIGTDDWAVELALPWSAVDVPPPRVGDEWRGNLCRSEHPGQRLYMAWSSTGGLFHVPERFGRLQFAAGGAAQHAGHTLRGHVLHSDGQPAHDVPVRGFGRVARTDSSGAYVFDGVLAGPQVLSVISPAHEPFHGRVEVDQAVIELAPVTLQRIDPYRPAWQLSAGATGRWLASSLVEPPDMEAAPSEAAEPPADLDLTAAPGMTTSGAVAWMAGGDLRQPGARVVDWRTPAGAPTAVEAQVRWTQRLLKRLHYQTTADHAEFVWRFLWREPPARVAAGQLRQLVVTATAPDAPGTYVGQLQLLDGEQVRAKLPIRLHVGDFVPAPPEGKRVGTYFTGVDDNRGFDDGWREVMLRDIRAHGGVHVKWWLQMGIDEHDGQLLPDASRVREDVLLQHRLGFEPPYTVGTAAETIARRLGIPGDKHALDADALRASDAFRQTYSRFVRAARDLEAELDVGPFALFWSDEIFQPGRLEPWLAVAALTRQLTDQPIYITHHSGDPEKVERIDPYVDIRCYHGRRLDDDYTSAAAYDTLRRELEESGDVAWAYYNVVRTDITPEFTRLVNGYWLWRTPVSVHVPWTYYSGRRGSLEGVREGAAEAPFFAFAAPHPERREMVSTLDWECFREGWNDLLFVSALERAAAAVPDDPVARRARALLAAWWDQDPRATSQAEALSAADYAARRTRMLELTEALR